VQTPYLSPGFGDLVVRRDKKMSEEYRKHEEEGGAGFEIERQLALTDIRSWIKSLIRRIRSASL